jgi:hypothetical protein
MLRQDLGTIIERARPSGCRPKKPSSSGALLDARVSWNSLHPEGGEEGRAKVHMASSPTFGRLFLLQQRRPTYYKWPVKMMALPSKGIRFVVWLVWLSGYPTNVPARSKSRKGAAAIML